VPLSTLGLLQYLTPVLQFLLGVLYFHEAMPPERWAGFALVWLALSLLTWDALRSARRPGIESNAPGTTMPTGTVSGVRNADGAASGPDPVDARP
jgi:chloramphenicol-sensitive protein RarD